MGVCFQIPKLLLHLLSQLTLVQTPEVGVSIVLILQMRSLSLRPVKWLLQVDMMTEWSD